MDLQDDLLIRQEPCSLLMGRLSHDCIMNVWHTCSRMSHECMADFLMNVCHTCSQINPPTLPPRHGCSHLATQPPSHLATQPPSHLATQLPSHLAT